MALSVRVPEVFMDMLRVLAVPFYICLYNLKENFMKYDNFFYVLFLHRLSYPLAPIYIGEIATEHSRGKLLSITSINLVIGGLVSCWMYMCRTVVNHN